MPIMLAKGLLAGIIVGFVTASIRSWVDRFFLVILLISLLKFPIQEAITVNLIVVSLAVLMNALRQADVLMAVREDWPLVIVPASLGAMVGRVIGLEAPARVLLILLGIYAILAGIRMLIVRPLPEGESPAHPGWLAPMASLAALVTGLLSAGAKAFLVPYYNIALGRHPRQAYALAALSVSVAAPTALATQIALGHFLSPAHVLWAVYLFVVIISIAFFVERYWTPRLNKIVTLTVAPLLILVGVRFLWLIWR